MKAVVAALTMISAVDGFAGPFAPVSFIKLMAKGFSPLRFSPRPTRTAWLRMQVQTTSAFTLSDEEFEPAQVELQRSWFQAWGFGEPNPPKDASGAGMGMGGGAKGKGGKAKGPPKAASNAKLYCKAPGRDLVTIYRAAGDRQNQKFSKVNI